MALAPYTRGGHRFSLGEMRGGELVGAAIISRPVARQYDSREEKFGYGWRNVAPRDDRQGGGG